MINQELENKLKKGKKDIANSSVSVSSYRGTYWWSVDGKWNVIARSLYDELIKHNDIEKSYESREPSYVKHSGVGEGDASLPFNKSTISK